MKIKNNNNKYCLLDKLNIFKNHDQDKKVFLIINNPYIGDILLINSLVQNIKHIYPNSIVVMLTTSNLADVAKYQYGVDDVIIWDRIDMHNNLLETIKFIKNFPYKKIFAAFPIYTRERSVYLSLLLNSKYILFYKQNKRFSIPNLLLRTKYKIKCNGTTMQEYHASLLTGITKEKLENKPILYNVTNNDLIKDYRDTYISLCCTSTRTIKDMPFEVVCQVIETLKDYKIILLGSGQLASELSEKLKTKYFSNLVDLTNKTTILETVNYINNSVGMVSVDTGLMHFACALKTPVVCVFYETNKSSYMPNPLIYKAVIVNKENAKNYKNIISALSTLEIAKSH